MSWPTSKCSYCPKQIVWTTTEKGKGMPVDPEVRADGNVVVWREDGTVRSKVLKKGENPMFLPDGGERHLPHFATCTGYAKVKRWQERNARTRATGQR